MDVVLNWSAQGVIVAVVAAAVLRVIPTSRAQARYGVVWTAYLLVCALPAMAPVLAIAFDGQTVDLPESAGPLVTMPANGWTSPAVAVGLWMIWSAIQAVRLGVGAFATRDMRRRGWACPADTLARLPHWSRLGASGRPVRVMLSDRVRAAAVLGCGRPTIALAPALVERLGAADLDRVLVHEWAHVQRYDDLSQLAQRLVRIVVGWHPASWWLEQQLEFEREAACDEIAVRVTGSPKGYAACLATLAALPGAHHRPVPALAAAAPSRLRGRLTRILATPSAAVVRPWRAITLSAGGGLVACATLIGPLHPVGSAVMPLAAAAIAHPLDTAAQLAGAERVAWQSMERLVRESSAAPPRGNGSRANPERATHRPSSSVRTHENETVDEQSAAAIALIPSRASVSAIDPRVLVPLATQSPELLSNAPDETPALAMTAATEPRSAEPPRAIWTRAADLGVGIGRVSQRSGVTTAGAFSRFGKTLAGAF